MHHVPESFARGGPTLKTFLVEEGTEDPNTTKSGPLSARQQNAILMVFRWRANDGPTLNAGLIDVILQRIRTRIAKKPYIFCDFSWGGGGGGSRSPPVSHLDLRMAYIYAQLSFKCKSTCWRLLKQEKWERV